jgi:hypothetical protein
MADEESAARAAREGGAKVWGRAYWMFLHTAATTYPEYPNEVVRRKYYDLIQNFPLFIPNEQMSVEFSYLLEKYPVSAYLDNRDSFMHWVFFIHNKINAKLEKEELLFEEAMRAYQEQFQTIPTISVQNVRFYKYHFFIALLVVLIFIIFVAAR